jgi:menaquinone-dependent protoporphyrinogen oxidase
MPILIAFGSKRGGTQGLAEMLADDLRAEGFTADVAPVGQAGAVAGYDAVIVGGALYAFRWHGAARRFVRHHAADLRQRPTYLFSSGPLDDSATKKDIPPVKGVKTLMNQVGARDHVTFGGRLTPDAKGFPASAMAKKSAGDWRDPEHVQRWARTIATQLRAGQRQNA